MGVDTLAESTAPGQGTPACSVCGVPQRGVSRPLSVRRPPLAEETRRNGAGDKAGRVSRIYAHRIDHGKDACGNHTPGENEKTRIRGRENGCL